MTEDHMSETEKPDSTDIENAQSFPNIEKSVPLNPNSLMGPHIIRIPDILRREKVNEDRSKEAEEKLRADLSRISILQRIGQELNETRFNESALNPQLFPDIEQVLSAYQNSSATDKQRRKEGIRIFTEKTIKGTFTRLSGDIKVLYLDRGDTHNDADKEIQTLTESPDPKKKKGFGNIGKDAQIAILENMSHRRSELLTGNMIGQYLYFLRAYQDELSFSSEKIKEIEDQFSNASDQFKTKIAAETRIKALKAMEKFKNANIERLRALKIWEGDDEYAIDRELETMQANYSIGTLQQKSEIIESILDKKASIGLRHLDKIIKLRQTLEGDATLEQEPLDVSHIDLDSQRLAEETAQIEYLVKIMVKNNQKNTGFSYGEADTSDMANSIDALAVKHQDPELSETFQLIRLLRNTPSEIFKL